MDIYIASSFRNLNAVKLLRDSLAAMGHNILDWTRLAPPVSSDMTLAERKTLFDSDERGKIFTFCATSCEQADLVIYLGPAGQDAACEIGMAYAAGVPVFGVAGPLEMPGLVMTRCVRRWFSEFGPLYEAVRELENSRLSAEKR